MNRKLKKGLSCLLIILALFTCVSVALPTAEAKTDTQRNIFYFFKNNMGLNTAGACGLMANIEKESGFNPNLVSDSGTSYGICQWHNERWTSLKNFCNENGYDWKSITGQLYYLKYELETFYPNTFGEIKSVPNTAQGAYDAAFLFCYNFERPANKTASSEKRGELAKSTYWPRYGFKAGTRAPTLKLYGETTSVSSRDKFSFYWSTGKGTISAYKFFIVKCVDGAAEYDWNSMKQYEIAATDKKVQWINPAELSAGNYLAWVYGVDKSTGKRTDFSNFVFFSVYDEMIYETESPVNNKTYDADVTKNILLKGWAVNTGKLPVSFSYRLDKGDVRTLSNVSRSDVYSEYKAYCVSDKVGYSLKLPTEDISNGEHTLTVYADSKTLKGTLATIKFTVINSHDHSFTNYISDNNATYTKNGTKTAMCDLCSSSNTVEIKNSRLVLGNTEKITASPGEKSVTLKWTKVRGATGYRVYIYKNGWELLDTTGSASYKVTGLSAAKKYRFAVKAYAAEKNVTALAPGYTETKATTRPAEVTRLAAAESTSSVKLSWTKSNGATGYRVYRFNTSTKSWDVAVRSTKNLTATVSGLKSATKYLFAVRPYINTGSEILWSESYTKVTVITKLNTPDVRVASTAKGRATVAWSNVYGDHGYQVWYSTKPGSGYKKIGNYSSDTFRMYKTGLTSGKTYYFKVRAYKRVGNDYIYSNLSSYKALKIK